MLTLRYLGPVAVSVDGAAPPAELLWRKNLALLIYLAHSPRGRTREHLVGVLWPDKDDARARHSLNEALRVLRRTLGAALNTEGETISIEAGAIVSDLDRLAELDQGSIAVPFLEGFAVPDAPAFEEWVAGQRQQVLQSQLAILGRRAATALNEGATSAAQDLALLALRLDPHHEASARLAMKAFALGGDRARALRIFEELKQTLQQLGIEPDQASRSLADRIGRERLYRGAPPVAVPVRPRAPLAGSARTQLAAILAAWEEVRSGATGGARAIAILGDPGTGKTRILDEIGARARLDGAAVARARAAEATSGELFAALIRDGLLVPEVAGASPSALAAFAEVDPDVAVRFPAARAARPIPLDDAFRAAIQAIAEARPVVLLLDDAHRASAGMLGDLGTLVERCRGLPLLLLLAGARALSDGMDRLAERIGRDLPGAVLRVGPFTEADVAGLVQATFPTYPAAQHTRLARRVFSDTAGNPFLASELIRAVRDGLNLPSAPSAWPSASHTLDDTRPGDLPESVAAALRLRYRQLSGPAQQALAAVAVLGGALPEESLARAADLSGDKLRQALDELEWSHWLIGDASGYGFTIGLAREVVLADMVTGGQQRRMRERAGLR